MEIRPLSEHDAATYWNLRLEALQNEPFAFGKSVEEHQAMSVESFATRFREQHASNFTLGTFEGYVLIGIATFVRDSGSKERHKGHLYGVYVNTADRGKGVGNALIAAVLRKAGEDPSLEQILLAVAVGQKAACALYRSFGFEVYGTEPRALKVGGDYVDEHHMLLRLR